MVLQLFLYADSSSIDKKIYSTILRSIFPKKETIYVYTDSQEKKQLFSQIKNIFLVDKENADIFIIGKINHEFTNKNEIIFVDNYHAFKNYKDIAIGGFYWKKGRPNLVFIKENLQKHDIKLPAKMKKYIYSDL